MKNLLTSAQMRAADAHVIQHLPMSSLNLMENAADVFVEVFKEEVKYKKTRVAILCGQGNNGGDGLAIARLLAEQHYDHITVYLINFAAKQSEDYDKNLKRLPKNVPIVEITHPEELKDLTAEVIVDAILGSGLNKPLQNKFADLAALINGLHKRVIAVDVPTGLNAEGPISAHYNGIKAELVISFDRPKINFFFPECVNAMERFTVAEIGLAANFIEKQPSDWKLTTKADVRGFIKPRKNFSHKGTYGHVCIVAGNDQTMGAALLAAGACLHIGAGLTTLCLPESGLVALNTSLPEVMALPRNKQLEVSAFEKFSALAIGPGLGVDETTETLFAQLIALQKPMVIDADGLTILSKKKELLNKLPPNSILTPHLKEFDRLFGVHQNWWDRVATAKKEAKNRNLVIVLKNQFTFVCLPTGAVHINPTGNPAMASGGMGDVLAGMIVGLLAQGYPPTTAAILATYLHGRAGDKLAKKQAVVIASQVIKKIATVMKKLR